MNIDGYAYNKIGLLWQYDKAQSNILISGIKEAKFGLELRKAFYDCGAYLSAQRQDYVNLFICAGGLQGRDVWFCHFGSTKYIYIRKEDIFLHAISASVFGLRQALLLISFLASAGCHLASPFLYPSSLRSAPSLHGLLLRRLPLPLHCC